ncbi:fructokinase [Microbacterium saccharophilum]|uniref:carbohydrate kinase family protein n=1 Tax=Microbacterium saccharophilum TaxID=1213358 RepID=UPI001195C609|nr:carbohydrate kinase [Microbacterium saccharophilum]GEP48029.1 fructokinase [Microbacterium saccharophilum]
MSTRSRDGYALVVGEALIDIVEVDGQPSTEHVGGSPGNVALGLGRLGVPVRLLTALGRDDRGRNISDHLRSSGVQIDPRSWTLARTSTARARIGGDGSAAYEFDIEWPAFDAFAPPAAGLVHVGSLGALVNPGAADVLRLVRTLPPGAVLTFDPNIRPRLLSDRATATAQVSAITQRADFVKLSDEDAAWLYPGLDADNVLDLLLDAGARAVALTRGSAGAELASPDARVHVDALPVHVTDTVGAGDSFMAAIARELFHERVGPGEYDADTLTRLGRRGAQAAAVTVTRVGADLPRNADLPSSAGGATLPRRTFLAAALAVAGAATIWRLSDTPASASEREEATAAPDTSGHASIVGVL